MNLVHMYIAVHYGRREVKLACTKEWVPGMKTNSQFYDFRKIDTSRFTSVGNQATCPDCLVIAIEKANQLVKNLHERLDKAIAEEKLAKGISP